jgi:hypothetical protein
MDHLELVDLTSMPLAAGACAVPTADLGGPWQTSCKKAAIVTAGRTDSRARLSRVPAKHVPGPSLASVQPLGCSVAQARRAISALRVRLTAC